MKFSVSLRGARPPLPKARPAKRYRGIAEKPHRLASRARTARPTTARPSSMKTWEKSCVVIGISNREQNTSCHHTDDLNSCPNIIPPSDAPRVLGYIRKLAALPGVGRSAGSTNNDCRTSEMLIDYSLERTT